MHPHTLPHDCLTIVELALKNQALIARSLDLGLLGHARELRRLDDKLLRALKQAEHLTEEEQRAQGFTHYIWHTIGDDKVRPSHAANDGKIFSWDDPPSTGHPGEDYGCRCWAEPLPDDPPIEPVYPLEAIIGGMNTRVGRVIWNEILRRISRPGQIGEAAEDEPVKKPTTSEQDRLGKPEGMPDDWKETSSNKGEGVKYGRPGREKYDEVRIQKGNPKSSNPAQQKDYVKWKKDGQYLDKNGNKVSGNSPEAHIPADEFKFDKDIFQ